MAQNKIKLKHRPPTKYFNPSLLLKNIGWIISKIPVITCMLFFIVSLIPINNYFISQKPPFFLLPFFYWMVKRPENMGLLYVLIIAFIYDVIDNHIFGVNIFLIMMIYSFMLYQKFIPINRNYLTHYTIFMLIVLLYYMIKYVIYSKMFNTNPDIIYVVFNYLTLIVLYPVVYYILQKINKYIK